MVCQVRFFSGKVDRKHGLRRRYADAAGHFCFRRLPRRVIEYPIGVGIHACVRYARPRGKPSIRFHRKTYAIRCSTSLLDLLQRGLCGRSIAYPAARRASAQKWVVQSRRRHIHRRPRARCLGAQFRAIPFRSACTHAWLAYGRGGSEGREPRYRFPACRQE